MGTDISIKAYQRRPENREYSECWEQLPSSWRSDCSWEYSRHEAPVLFDIFGDMLKAKAGGLPHVKSFVRFTVDDIPAIISKIRDGDRDRFEGDRAIPKDELIAMFDKWHRLLIDGRSQFGEYDLYFCWV